MIKAAFIDFDGTLYSHKTNGIPASALEAINTLRSKGIKVFLCSGRAPVEMDWFDLKDMRLDGYVFTNGQMVFDENMNLIYGMPVEGELKEIFLKIFNEKLLPIYLSTVDDIYINYVDEQTITCQNRVGSPVPRVDTYKGETVYMSSIFVKDESQLEKYHLRDLAEVTYWQEGAVDVCPKNVSKVTGMQAMLEYVGLSLDDCIGFGDGHNDMEMIQACKIGVCMGNGKDEIKNIADYITSDIDEDGIYNACKYYGLI